MKQYVRLSVNAQAYYSGRTYYEEVFLPLEMWEEIKENVEMEINLGELDGKHSQVIREIEVDFWSLENFTGQKVGTDNDGERLLEHIYEYIDINQYNYDELDSLQEEVQNLCQVEKITITINKNQKEEVLKLLENYIIQ